MPMELTINGQKVLAERIIIEEFRITIEPFQGMSVSGSIPMDFEVFDKLRDRMIKFPEAMAEEQGRNSSTSA